MITLRQFIDESKKKVPPVLVTAEPVHGGHSRRRKVPPVIVTAEPVHGGHSRRRRRDVKEDYGHHGPFKPGEEPKPSSQFDWKTHNANKHLGKHEVDVHDKINMSRDEWNEHPHSQALFKYTQGSKRVNRKLIKKANGEDPHAHDDWGEPIAPEHQETDRKEHESWVHQIDHALKHKKLEHDLHVYHGTDKWNPGEVAAQHPNREVHLPAYTSTSIERRTAKDFAGYPEMNGGQSHILHIHLKKGQHGTYLGSHSDFAHEKEFLMPRGTTLKIHHKPTKLDDGTHVWHAHVVDD